MLRRLHADEWLFASATGLALFGVVMVYSASAALVAVPGGASSYTLVIKQGVWTLIGLGVLIFAMRLDYERLRDPRIVFGLLGVTFLLLVAVFAFPRINGARRWIRFGGFSMQPSELAKIALTIYLARFLERRAGIENSFRETFFPAVAVIAAFAAIVLAEPDFGTALMLVITGLVMLYAAGARLWHLGLAIVPALMIGAPLIIFVPWRFARMLAFLDPWADAQGKGFQTVQSLIAVGSGGINGLGFANGKQKMLFLPFAHSDFIFAVVGEELGLVGALALLVMFGVFLWRGLRAALNAPDRFGMLLGIGIVAGIVAQALLNMSVVLSLVPTKGIALPFISYGGSSLIPTMFAVGVLLNISQRQSQSL
jgi:cell division protein FtsW